MKIKWRKSATNIQWDLRLLGTYVYLILYTVLYHVIYCVYIYTLYYTDILHVIYKKKYIIYVYYIIYYIIHYIYNYYILYIYIYIYYIIVYYLIYVLCISLSARPYSSNGFKDSILSLQPRELEFIGSVRTTKSPFGHTTTSTKCWWFYRPPLIGGVRYHIYIYIYT